MDQSTTVWILIVLSLFTANLPFFTERPLLVLPWVLKGQPNRPWWVLWPASALFFVLLGGLGYGALNLIGSALLNTGDIASVGLFFGKIFLAVAAAVLLLGFPGWLDRNCVIEKSFFDRLLEVLTMYGLVGVLGFAFEANIGNIFGQRWQFYAVTLSLFVVLAYPGFVFRYLMRRRKPVKPRKSGS